MKTMIHAKRRRIPLSKVRTAHSTIREHVEDLRASTRAKPPILVIESRSGKTYQILDGHHRAELARWQNRKTLTAFVVPRTVYHTHAAYLDIFKPYGSSRRIVAPMSLDDMIEVTWRGQKRRYEYMRGDNDGSILDREVYNELIEEV